MMISSNSALSPAIRRGMRPALLLALSLSVLLQAAAQAYAAQRPAQPPTNTQRRLCSFKCQQYECPTVRCNMGPYNECINKCMKGS